MSEIVVGPLKFTYHSKPGFIDVELANHPEPILAEPIGTFEMDDETWRAFEAAAQLPPEKRAGARVIAAFTISEARGLGIASVFGVPDNPPAEVIRARKKLREALQAAGGDIGF